MSIGKHIGRDGKLHAETNWYFAGALSQEQANREAERVQGAWNWLVLNWETAYRPGLRMEGDPHSEAPHWPRTETLVAIPAVPAHSAVPNTIAEDDGLTLQHIASLYEEDRRFSLNEHDIQNATYLASVRRVYLALGYLPSGLPLRDLTIVMVHEAKAKMLARLSRRSTANLLIELGRMLKWFYESSHGYQHRRIAGLERALLLRRSKTSAIATYDEPALKALLQKVDDRKRMLVLLCLNCGMYAVDIGRLQKSEINLSESYCHWDREKEPDNPFHLYHELWPETVRLARRYYNCESVAIAVDYRRGMPDKVDCGSLAFVSYRDGKPLYRIGPSGSPANRIDRWLLPLGISVRSLRKTTNQMLIETARQAATDAGSLVAVGELSRMFLGQKSELLARLYSHSDDVKSAKIIYCQMNYYLGLVGNRLRQAGVFDCIQG